MPVSDGEIIIIFLPAGTYSPDQPTGDRIEDRAMRSDEFGGIAGNSGPSGYLKSALPNGIAELENLKPKWKQHGYIEVPVAEFTQLGISVELTPDECTFPAIKHAHVSLVKPVPTKNERRKLRKNVLSILENFIVRVPDAE